MWLKKIRKYKNISNSQILGYLTIVIIGLLIVSRSLFIEASMARNIGAIYLLDDLLFNSRKNAETWLNYSYARSENIHAQRLLGKNQQLSGNIDEAMAVWQDANLKAFAINTGLQELKRTSDEDAVIWAEELQNLISVPADWEQLAISFETRGDYISAINAYQIALEQADFSEFPDHEVSKSEIYYRIAHIYEDQFSDNSNAIEAYFLAVNENDFQNTWHNVESNQKLAIYLIDQEPEKAVNFAYQAVDLMPNRALSHSILGLALYSANSDFALAEQEIQRAIELDRENVWPWMHLGEMYLRANEYELALSAYSEAAKLDPEFHEAAEMVTYISKTFLEK